MSNNNEAEGVQSEIDKSPRTVLFYGMSGAGKGTQAKLLLEKLQQKRGTHFIEVGQMLRDYAAHGGNYGARRIKETMIEGALVPPSVSAYLWTQKLLENVGKEHNVIFDGAARSIAEATLLHKTLEWLGRPYTIFILRIEPDVATARAVERGDSRADDTIEAMESRLAWFKEQTMPAINYMQEQGAEVHMIDGGQSVEEVQAEILARLNL